MRKYIFITIIILGCNSKNEFQITNLNNVSIFKYIHSNDGVYNSGIPTNKICTLTNPDSINFVLNVLNSKKQEFRKFMPEYNIELNYADTTIEIGVYQKFIKIKGKAYKVNSDLSNYFVSLNKHRKNKGNKP